MNLIRAIKIKLDMASVQDFKPLIEAYANSFNHVCQVGYKDKDCNGVSLHNKTYYHLRPTLPAQLVISSRAKATEALKSLKKLQEKENKRAKIEHRPAKVFKCPHSKHCSIRYDENSYNIWMEKSTVSLLTLSGRKKYIFSVAECYKQYLSWTRCSADLFIRDGSVFLHVIFHKEVEDPVLNQTAVGIDRGINNIAVLSNNTFYKGGKNKNIAKKYERLRKILQRKKHSGKRHFKKIKHKENRFTRDVNHSISKQIVHSIHTGTTIVFEDLTDIRNQSTRTTEYKQSKRKQVNKWSFFQLEQFITYKAQCKGINTAYVNAAYTSQTCSKCGCVTKENRATQCSFKCVKCGFQLHADLNGSRVIEDRYFSLDTISSPESVSVTTRVDAPRVPRPLVVASS